MNVYPTGFGDALVEEVTQLPSGLLDAADLPMTGFRSVKEVWLSAGQHTKSRVEPNTLLYRVQFRMCL